MTLGEDPELETIRIEAEKISQKGKARFRAEDGTESFVEEIALHHFRKEGWGGVWGENDLWWTLMALLFWDVIFARIDGVWTPQFGSFPSPLQDMPQDMFKREFYQRRAHLVERRMEHLHRADLEGEMRKSLREHYGQPCRPIENWDKFDVAHLACVTALIPRDALLGILHVLLQDFNENRSGLPDLLLSGL